MSPGARKERRGEEAVSPNLSVPGRGPVTSPNLSVPSRGPVTPRYHIEKMRRSLHKMDGL
jgi:hypothetical protein